MSEIRKCLNCGKDISHKHVNAKFCRNKGRKNCKDKYNNRNSVRSRDLVITKRKRREITNEFIAFHSFDPGWDDHKDSF